MPSKIRKAIGVMKDHTSLSLAKVSYNNSYNLDIAVLKATTHEEVPVEERYVNEVVMLTSTSDLHAAGCVQAIAKRIGRTRNWVVAVKSLTLVLRIFQEGDPHFPREVLHAMKRGSKILNLSSFRDGSYSSPMDYSAFVRTFALYLDERLDCFLTGKFHRRAANKHRDQHNRSRRLHDPISNMMPPVLIDNISCWQRLLDRVIATRPTGAAKHNRLVHIALHSVVRESFDLYRDISDSLALLLDRFFHLKYQVCVDAFQTCIRASKQFKELSDFYDLCKSIGVGRTSEYPSVQKVSDELIDTLREFLKDHASFRRPPNMLLPASTVVNTSNCERLLPEASRLSDGETSEHPARVSEERSLETEDEKSVTNIGGSSPCSSVSTDQEQSEIQSQLEDLTGMNEWGTSSCPSPSVVSVGQRSLGSSLDLVRLFDDQPRQEEGQRRSVSGSVAAEREGWELVLAETANDISSNPVQSSKNEPLFNSDRLSDQCSFLQQKSHNNNPFLQDMGYEITTQAIIPPIADVLSSFPTFQVPPTSCAQGPSGTDTTATATATVPSQIQNDPFASCNPMANVGNLSDGDGSMNQHHQQLWLQTLKQDHSARNVA
ncbi:PREDICTED: clathrin coat assembly protein AP180-like [Nelumbo nucifera]|uniref:ENTH domain-containing protein n=2 Tax=Nelumbo nucifera TaxID=4432 RepID=A0A822XWG1_NELNU|nr:PREDICTED: clathrin coat assembly protein AP180-like [Nelumbo nucifera]DAD23491.1 TPA_asm: hypothetical protein HUJ06_024954 [Nelumbo nucifera]